MSEPDYSQITKEKLVELCSRSSNTVDGLWFLAVEQKYGLDVALKMDEEVWQRLGQIHTRRLLKTFTIKEDSPIRTLVKLLEVDPIWVVFKHEIPVLTDNKAIFRVTDCPAQVARVRDGKGEFPCEGVETAFFTSYAEAVDPRIRVTCLLCPPAAHPPQYWCEWQFEI